MDKTEVDITSTGATAAVTMTTGNSNVGEAYCQPVRKGGKFDNPFDTWKFPNISGLFKFVFREKNNSGIPSKEELDRTLPVVKPDQEKLNDADPDQLQCTWIGHATCLVQLEGVNVLTDPVFSDRCAPVQFMGPKRYRPPALTVSELPDIHAVVISHNHYDHLDYHSVKDLHRRFGDNIHWFVPQGLKSWVTSFGCQKVTEMTWWDEYEYTTPQNTKVTFACLPAQHWCKRTATDTNKVLWAGWGVIGQNKKFYFAGDTGYCLAFKQIGTKYGPFNLAAIPIGAYCPRWFMKPQHIDPEEAVKVFEDVQAKNSIGIHWGTFPLSNEPYMEPKEKLEEEMKKFGLNPERFQTYNHGRLFSV